jgi:DNA-binding IclR family transcriptional regulator
MSDPTPAEALQVLPQLRIDELPGRVASVRSSRDQVRKLLEAVFAIGSGLDVEAALTKIMQVAATLVDARCGALGVIGADQRLARSRWCSRWRGRVGAMAWWCWPCPASWMCAAPLMNSPLSTSSRWRCTHMAEAVPL